jgi:hypothetical protein
VLQLEGVVDSLAIPSADGLALDGVEMYNILAQLNITCVPSPRHCSDVLIQPCVHSAQTYSVVVDLIDKVAQVSPSEGAPVVFTCVPLALPLTRRRRPNAGHATLRGRTDVVCALYPQHLPPAHDRVGQVLQGALGRAALVCVIGADCVCRAGVCG